MTPRSVFSAPLTRALMLVCAFAALAHSAQAGCKLDEASALAAGAPDASAGGPTSAAGDWMRIALSTAVMAELEAPAATRLYAVTAVAMHDAYALTTGSKPYAVNDARPHGVAPRDAEIVIQSAAASLLTEIYPRLKLYYAAKLEGLVPQQVLKKRAAAREFGAEIGRQIFKRCYYALEDYREANRQWPIQAGAWRPTKSYYNSGLEPDWPSQKPFELARADQLGPYGPPDLGSDKYARALNEVKALGKQRGGTRTAEQSLIARFWRDGMQTSTPSGHWNLIALQEIANLPLRRQVKILLVLNVAMADAGLAAWTGKYKYLFWRPIFAIREAANDGNPMTTPDDKWWPFLETPMHPDYVSGHSTFSAAAATVLTHYLGAYPITIGTQSIGGDVRRSYASFQDAAQEAGRSRIYGGIHYSFSNEDGLTLGKTVAEYVIQRVDGVLID